MSGDIGIRPARAPHQGWRDKALSRLNCTDSRPPGPHRDPAEAHHVSGSRYGLGFGGQWRHLLDDTHDALIEREFRSHKLTPGGHKVGVVNDCLVYVWRVPDDPNAVQDFASSPTRPNGFAAPPPPAMLWEGPPPQEVEPA